jgi:hypothetical protein
MNHCVSIPMIFVSAIFARLSRQMTRATLTAKMALTAKMRDAHVSWRGLHLLPKWRPTCAHKKSRTQFLLSDSSGISELKQVTFLTTRTAWVTSEDWVKDCYWWKTSTLLPVGVRVVKNVTCLSSLLSIICDVDVKDDVKMASKWRGISIHGHNTPFSRRLWRPRPRSKFVYLQSI